ncbi:MAG: DUF2656 family protein [Cyanobacteria bacterium P01_F01_bin.3]
MSESLAQKSTVLQQGRMLLSHNFNLADNHAPMLSREAFTQVFIEGLGHEEQILVQLIAHPHWITEIVFDTQLVSPQQIGHQCAIALSNSRKNTSSDIKPYEILTLGGLKTTSPTSRALNALQTGEWGVDVVETVSGDAFLKALNWDAMISQKPDDQTFMVKVSV